MENQVSSICICGRSYLHCKQCGKRGPYYKKYRSLELTALKGREVKVYGHSCGVEFSSEDTCAAPKVAVNILEQEEFTPGSLNHAQALAKWVEEKQREKKWDRVRVYVEAQKAGWHLEAFPEMDEDVRQALEEAGLLKGAGVEKQITVAVTPAEDQAPSTPSEPIPLEDIIKQMQEDSK